MLEIVNKILRIFFLKGKVVLIDAMICKSEIFNVLESSNSCRPYKYIHGELNRI